MPKLQTFYIEYQPNNGRIFFPGQTVNGRVVIILNEPMKMRQVRLLICGKAHIHWTQSKDTWHTDVDGTSHYVNSTRVYKDSENYIHSEITVWGKGQSSSSEENPTMPAGTNYFNFSFVLPAVCPSSFEGERGYIRYFCKASIDRPWKTDLTSQQPLSLISLVDLNGVPGVDAPRRVEKSHTLHSFLWVKKAGNLHFEVIVPRCGFVPGEVIPFEVKINNDTSTEVSWVSVKLIQMTVLIAHDRHTHTCEREVACVQKNNISAKQSVHWVHTLKVPPVAPTTKTRVLEILYRLSISANPKGMHNCQTVFIPIFIGNVPLRSMMPTLNQLRRSLSQEAASGTTPSAPAFPTELNIYPDLPLPSYEEAVFGQANINDDSDSKNVNVGSSSFAPKYTYYDWGEREHL